MTLRMLRRLPGPLLCITVISLVFSSPAAAYIDPGTGSIVLQMLVAGALGVAFTVKRFWKRIIASLRSAFRRS